MKTIVMTGSPKSAGFKTKATFLEQLAPFGFENSKRINKDTDILVTDDKYSQTNKMDDAKKHGVEIMTYEEMIENFELEGDL